MHTRLQYIHVHLHEFMWIQPTPPIGDAPNVRWLISLYEWLSVVKKQALDKALSSGCSFFGWITEFPRYKYVYMLYISTRYVCIYIYTPRYIYIYVIHTCACRFLFFALVLPSSSHPPMVQAGLQQELISEGEDGDTARWRREGRQHGPRELCELLQKRDVWNM